MNNKAIDSRTDLVTKDIRPEEQVEQTFNFPTLGVSVVAKSMDEALIKVKKLLKTNQ